MIDIIVKYEGTLDKFMGDCIMCYWGAPIEVADNAERAIKCAMEMQEKLQELNKKWQSEGKVLFDIGIGINTGEVVAGNIGDIRKMEYTVIGDNVNLAQRLEGLTSELKSKILISGSTYNKTKELVEVRKLEAVEVKGKSEKVGVWEVLGVRV